jgi:hypothetical protein
MPPLYVGGVSPIAGTLPRMDLGAYLIGAHTDLQRRLQGSVLDRVPAERWHEQADGGGSSIAWLLLHLARHQDLAVQAAIRAHVPIVADHATSLGLARRDDGLTEREDTTVTARLDPDALVAYVDAVFAATSTWLSRVSLMALDTVPDTDRRLRSLAGLDDDVAWLMSMWQGRTVGWLVQWPVLGHGDAHVGEAISVRNRMGLSPF